MNPRVEKLGSVVLRKDAFCCKEKTLRWMRGVKLAVVERDGYEDFGGKKMETRTIPFMPNG